MIDAPEVRSEGQRMFLHVTGSPGAIARALHMRSLYSIAEWRHGRRIPGIEARARIENVFGIPQNAWLVRPGVSLAVAAPSRPSDGPPPTTLDDCLALLAAIRVDRDKRELMSPDRIRLAEAEAKVLALRMRLEAAGELAEDRYVRDHPAWQRLERCILSALEPYPDASRAVVTAISRVFPHE
jgi:transcriptional regulator with XRE-family HTH domain